MDEGEGREGRERKEIEYIKISLYYIYMSDSLIVRNIRLYNIILILISFSLETSHSVNYS